jgi:hypothetical protein
MPATNKLEVLMPHTYLKVLEKQKLLFELFTKCSETWKKFVNEAAYIHSRFTCLGKDFV